MANIRGIELASEIYDLEDTSARDTATAASQTATTASQTATTASETATEANQKATTAGQTATEANEKIGDLADLKTTVKTNVVAALNELLTPVNIPNENISLRSGVTATTAAVRDMLQVGKVQSGAIYFSNLSATGIGGTSVVIVGSTSLRPTITQGFLGYDSKNKAVLRVLINQDGRIFIAESQGVVSGNNQINVPFTIIA